jgi:replicative DNA helicase
LKAAYERIEKLHQGEKGLRGVTTGFDELDSCLSGLQRSDLIILGARPSLGKTALCLDIARAASVKSQAPVGIFSLEMSRDQVIDRLIAAEAKVPLWKLRTGRLSDDVDFEMIQEALDRLSRAPIFIDDTPSMNIVQIRSMARRLQAEQGLGLLIVDYIQLIEPRTTTDNLVQAMTEVSRGLKGLARELETPILAAAQLSRAVEQREIKIPRLSDLRESGSLEQEADVVLFIYRKDRDKLQPSEEEENTAEIIVAKHRNGPLATVQLKFDPEKVSFRPIEKIHLGEMGE